MSACLDTLVSDLREVFDADPRGERAAELLQAYARSGADDWRPYAFYEDDFYTRNLVETNDRFELLLLCWSSGQRSPIHNHEGQNCWMSVLDGGMAEQRYRFPRAGGVPPAAGELRFGAGEVAFIRDEIALHDVRPANGSTSATLHLYAAPIPECSCYCDQTGRITRRRLSFYSVRGERTP